MSTDDENDYGGGREGGDASYDSDSSSSSGGNGGGCLKVLVGLFLAGVAVFAMSKCANGQDISSPRMRPLIEQTREIPYTDRNINYNSQSSARDQQQRDYLFRR